MLAIDAVFMPVMYKDVYLTFVLNELAVRKTLQPFHLVDWDAQTLGWFSVHF